MTEEEKYERSLKTYRTDCPIRRFFGNEITTIYHYPFSTNKSTCFTLEICFNLYASDNFEKSWDEQFQEDWYRWLVLAECEWWTTADYVQNKKEMYEYMNGWTLKKAKYFTKTGQTEKRNQLMCNPYGEVK